MASSSGAFTWDDQALVAVIDTINPIMDRAISAAMSFHATRAVSYARQNAPWTDRTGNARNGLFAIASGGGGKYRIDIGHSVPYGVWLEVRWNGRYQIIRPTVEHEGAEVMRTVAQIFRSVF